MAKRQSTRSRWWSIDKLTDEQRVVRFWSYIHQAGPDDCWPWEISLNHAGYGQYWITAKKRDLSHRIAWALTNGPICANTLRAAID